MTTSERLREVSVWRDDLPTKSLMEIAADELDTLKGLLRRVEFGFEYCPGCENSRETGHTKECPLAKALHE